MPCVFVKVMYLSLSGPKALSEIDACAWDACIAQDAALMPLHQSVRCSKICRSAVCLGFASLVDTDLALPHRRLRQAWPPARRWQYPWWSAIQLYEVHRLQIVHRQQFLCRPHKTINDAPKT